MSNHRRCERRLGLLANPFREIERPWATTFRHETPLAAAVPHNKVIEKKGKEKEYYDLNQ